MNCDDFLDALASSDAGRQTTAREHASSCENCAALAEVHAHLQRELGEPEPLPPRMRAVWEAAADDSSQTRNIIQRVQAGLASEALRPLHFLAIAATVLFLIVIPLLFWHLNADVAIEPKENISTVPAPAIAIREIDASAELTDLLAQVNALEAELNKTSKQADLVDVRREADILLATHSDW